MLQVKNFETGPNKYRAIFTLGKLLGLAFKMLF